MNELEIVPPEFAAIFEAMTKLAAHATKEVSPIQIREFILNDVEYPTEWGKFDQAKFELAHRFYKFQDLSFEVRKAQIEAKLKDEAIASESHPLKRELLEIEREQLEFRISCLKAQAKSVLKEAAVFFDYYQRYKHFDELPQDERLQLEKEQWAAKARNMPLVFEERYGDRFMKDVLGDSYDAFLAFRRQYFGLLPREIQQLSLGDRENILGRSRFP